jgi:dTDP-4-dehydrorhamnose reductase
LAATEPSQTPNILVTGATGQVGGALLSTLTPFGNLIAPDRSAMDLADPASIRTTIRRLRPRWIVNAAAYTAVDRAESESTLAYALNAEAPGIIGEEARTLGAAVLHFSTDYVFAGTGTLPYRETDPTGPLGVYGASKLAGEQALRASGAASLIFRTSWVYGASGKNFLRTILKLASERDTLRIVVDQHGAPTWSRDLARLTTHVIARCEKVAAETPADPDILPQIVGQVAGIYHAAGSGETTWAGFAEEAIRQVHRAKPTFELAEIVPIPTAEYPTPALRPANSRLSGEKLHRIFGYTMMDWRQSLAHVLAELA